MRELCIDEIESVSGGIDFASIDWSLVRDAFVREGFNDAAGGAAYGLVGGAFAGWAIPVPGVGPVTGAAVGVIGGAATGFIGGGTSAAFEEFMRQAWPNASGGSGGGGSGGSASTFAYLMAQNYSGNDSGDFCPA